MTTAGEKFFETLNNRELGFMAKTTGVRLEDWQKEGSMIDVNWVTMVVASRRCGKAVKVDDALDMTPKETQEKLEEFIGQLGFSDDKDDEAEDLAESDKKSLKS